jgi:hypothetical protein
MAAWRRKAIEYFPRFQRDFSDGRLPHKFSIYMVFFYLLPMLHSALIEGDTETARRIFDYAEWCSRRRSGEIANVVAVAFYEHLFDDREDWDSVVPYLAPEIICKHWNLWERRPTLGCRDLAELRRRLDYDRICDEKGRVRGEIGT